MTGAWSRILEKYGQSVTVWSQGQEEGTPCRAFLQPVLEKGTDFFQRQPTPLGLVRQDRWICLGGPEIALDELGDGYIAWGERKFSVRAAQPIHLGEELAYWWALLTVRDPEE